MRKINKTHVNEYIVTISFSKMDFRIILWHVGKIIGEVHEQNASKNLVLALDKLLQDSQISFAQIAKIGFLSGPGSFTSSRIVCATCAGLQSARKDLLVVPVRLDESIHNIGGYENTSILLRCNKHLWHLFTTKWSIVKNDELNSINLSNYTSMNDLDHPLGTSYQLPWPDLSVGIHAFTSRIESQMEIEPFYGL